METVSGIPVVDFGAFSIEHETRPSTESGEVQELARNIFRAFSTVGFVYLKNHGVTEAQIDDVLEKMDGFFDQDPTIKSRYEKAEAVSQNGWSTVGSQRTNSERPGDLREAFDVTNIHDQVFLWPDDVVPDFQSTMQLFYSQMKVLGLRVLSAMAIGLDLEPDTFERYFNEMGTDDGVAKLRLNYYPKLSDDTNLKPGQIRCGEHTDYGAITLLLQDEAGGLEVATVEGKYVPATPIKGTVLVNIADLMQRWTADRLKSAFHRVLIPEAELQRQTPRRSVIFFCNPDKHSVITCLDGSDKYPPVKAEEYVAKRVADSYRE